MIPKDKARGTLVDETLRFMEVTIRPGGETNLTLMHDRPFLARRLLLPAEVAASLLVVDVQADRYTLLATGEMEPGTGAQLPVPKTLGPGPIPGSVFSTAGPPKGMTPVVFPQDRVLAFLFRLILKNESADPVTVVAMLEGMELVPEKKGIDK